MKYLAHVDEQREQSVIEHLRETAQLAGVFAGKFGNADWGYCCGLLHDIGKYSLKFQKKIRGQVDLQVDHSTAGAQVCMKLGGCYQFMSYCIAGHHAGLPDWGRKGLPSTLCERIEKKVDDFSAYKNEVPMPNITTFPFDENYVDNPDFSMSVFIRMLYSCLVDADFLNTEDFMCNGRTTREPGETMDVLLEKMRCHILGWVNNPSRDSINGRRSEILRNCLEMGKSPKGLFQLTVPTGGGKTIASLAFALQHAVNHGMGRVIYVIPYTSIIEQNAQVFREILGDENVLEDHCNVYYEGADEFKSMQLATENWDKPVVVTTNVQFFESLYANKSSKCRKLHNIVNSVIIFDEAQMLPVNYLKPCIAMMEELLQKYRTSMVLCTATQPALLPFFSGKRTAMELCPKREEQFQFFERVMYQNIGTLTIETMIEHLKQEYQALCIVNTRKRAQRLFEELRGEGVYHLSTSMYPAHRRRVLEEIRVRIFEKKKCIVISTSLVEAGVDLDFYSVYRELAGVDSILQAAGRCNRNGTRKREESVVRVFLWEDKECVPGLRQQIDITQNLLAEGRDISKLENITEYFARLYHIKDASLDKKRILEEFQNHEYNFAKVGREFRIIEEDMITVFVHKEPEAEQLLSEIRLRGITKSLMRKAGQYCVNVYKGDGKQEKLFEKMYYAGMLRTLVEGSMNLFELTDKDQYQEETGLKLDVELGEAIMM